MTEIRAHQTNDCGADQLLLRIALMKLSAVAHLLKDAAQSIEMTDDESVGLGLILEELVNEIKLAAGITFPESRD